MQVRYRIAILSVALALAVGIYFVRRPAMKIGMTDAPCTEQGAPVAGNDKGDWAGLCIYRADNARLIASGKRPRAVLIGDSLTQEWPQFKQAGASDALINRGIGGQTSAQVLLRFPQDALSLRPQIIHILVGTNDIAGNTGANSPEMFKANLRAMVELAEANGAVVILGTIPPAKDFYWHPDVEPGDWFARLNTWIAAFAIERGLILADYRAAMTTSDGQRITSRYLDGSHPSPEGYAEMTRVFDRAMAEAEAKVSGRSSPKGESRPGREISPLP